MRPTSVYVDFSEGKVNPLFFVLGKREYKVERITLVFERCDGGKKYLCFAVDTGGMMAELVMDKVDFSWRIAKCQPSYI